jgi:hypothetical protein
VTGPKKRKKRQKPSDDRQLPLLETDAHFPAVVANPPMSDSGVGEDEPLPEPAAPARRRRARASGRWWHRHWNLIVGLCFIPFACIFTTAFLHTFGRAIAGGHGLPFWMKHEFLMFALGAVAWFAWLLFCFWKWREPRPVFLYVLGHELTHAAVVKLCFGTVKRFHATSDGGYIETNKYNFFIALAPYLWPFYSIPLLAAWSLSLVIPGVPYFREIFLLGLGFTWMFHLTFTLWMLPKGQTDFRGPGLLFSFTLIYTVNVILLTGALVSFARAVTWRGYFSQLMESAVAFYDTLLHGLAGVLHEIGHLFQVLFG